MPMYEFECGSCNMVFEELVDRNTSHCDCPDCGSSSPKSSQTGYGGFQFERGKTSGNSGVDSLDSSIDKHIGRDARDRWEYLKDRKSYKRKVQRKHGEVGDVPLQRDPKRGDYDPIDDDDLEEVRDRIRTVETADWVRERDAAFGTVETRDSSLEDESSSS